MGFKACFVVIRFVAQYQRLDACQHLAYVRVKDEREKKKRNEEKNSKNYRENEKVSSEKRREKGEKG